MIIMMNAITVQVACPSHGLGALSGPPDWPRQAGRSAESRPQPGFPVQARTRTACMRYGPRPEATLPASVSKPRSPTGGRSASDE